MSQALKEWAIKKMAEAEFERAVDAYELDEAYSDYIINHTDARICNGDMLIEAIESGCYYEAFKEHMTGA